jgi:hypothetical protein
MSLVKEKINTFDWRPFNAKKTIRTESLVALFLPPWAADHRMNIRHLFPK